MAAEVKQSPTPDTVVEVGAVEDFGRSQSEPKYSDKFREKQPPLYVVDPDLIADEAEAITRLEEMIGDNPPATQPQVTLTEELRSRMIELEREYPEIIFLVRLNGVGCFSIGDIQAIKAKAKQGKTFTIICIIVALIRGSYMGFTATRSDLRVLYLDTEMNPLNTAKLAKKVHRLCGLPTDKSSDRFYAMNLRGDAPALRCKLLRDAIEAIKPDAVFIDGVKDLIESDINDQKESGKVVQMLMTLTKEHPIALISVLHTNKALTDSNMRGSIGTELTNKVSEVWEVKKDGNVFEATQDISRNQPVDGFSFTLNEYGEPIPVDFTPKLSRTDIADAKMRECLKAAIPPPNSMSYTELLQVYSELAGCATKTAQTHVAQATKKGIIERGRDGNYRLNL